MGRLRSGVRRGRAKVLAALVLLAACASAMATQGGARDLFRKELTEGPKELRWKGALSDETLLALAVSGAAWRPTLGGVALIEQDRNNLTYAPAERRRDAWRGARGGGDARASIAFAFSLVLDPPLGDDGAWRAAFRTMERFGSEFDDMLVGILEAPEKLPLLRAYEYAAADALVWRASPRMLSLLVTLARSEDRYLRSRAVAALGIVAYRQRPPLRSGVPGLRPPLRETTISAVQTAMLAEIFRDAAEDGNWRVRAAAALAFGLLGDERDVPVLRRMLRDKAYLSWPEGGRDVRRIAFPVRAQAAAALTRFGQEAPDGGGVYSGQELKTVLRGGRDVSGDRSGMRRDRSSNVRFHDGFW